MIRLIVIEDNIIDILRIDDLADIRKVLLKIRLVARLDQNVLSPLSTYEL